MSFRTHLRDAIVQLNAYPAHQRGDNWRLVRTALEAAADLHEQGRKAKSGVVLQRAMRALQPAERQ